MDTSSLRIRILPETERNRIPHEHLEAIRQGARRAIELLRPERRPRRITIVLGADAARALDSRLRRAHGKLAAHDREEIALSYPALLSFAEQVGLTNERAAVALSYCAAHATALFSAPKLAPSAIRRAEDAATAACGFQLAPEPCDARRRARILDSFLWRLEAIRSAEGPAALWRGELRKMIEALAENVRFGKEPRSFGAQGQKMQTTQVLALIDFRSGLAPWPFSNGQR